MPDPTPGAKPDPLLDPPAGAPAWLPRVDDERSVWRLRIGVIVVLALGIAAFVIRGADRPADPQLVRPDGTANVAAPTGGAPPGTPPGDPARVPLKGFREIAIAITDPDGDVIGWCVLLANSTERHQRGLMEVTDLRGYPGMLFTFQEDRTNPFWMRNTPMPLSIAFFDSKGALVSTSDMVPCDGDPNCPLYPPASIYRYALEVPQGQLDDLGIAEGSRLRIFDTCAPRDTS